MKSKFLYLFYLLCGEELMFWALHSQILLIAVIFPTLWLNLFPYRSITPLPEILLKKSKIVLAFVFWSGLFWTLHTFVKGLSCLHCMQSIQRENAKHFWNVQNSSVWTWVKNVFHAYPQPVLLFSILGTLGIIYVLVKKVEWKK